MSKGIKSITITILCIICLSFSHSLPAAEFQNTTGDLTLTTNTTITTGDKWIRNGNLTINPGVSLTVDEDLNLSFDEGYRINTIKPLAKIIKTPCTQVTCYSDNDLDTHYATTGTSYCRTCPAGTRSTPGDDCNDNCATCYPGSGTTTATPDGKDQDCNGVVDDRGTLQTLVSCSGYTWTTNLETWGIATCAPVNDNAICLGDCQHYGHESGYAINCRSSRYIGSTWCCPYGTGQRQYGPTGDWFAAGGHAWQCQCEDSIYH